VNATTPGFLLRQARERAALTQAELARRAGTRQSAISAVETGLRDPGVGTLRRLLAAAGFDVELRLIAAGDRSEDRLRRTRIGEHVARGEAGGSSDLDLLVELPARTSILTLGRIAREVERIVGVETDVVPEAALRPEVRARVLAEAVPL